jgi:hypothetical protein
MSEFTFGSLADHFIGVGAKTLSDVEVNKAASNQHEFQGISSFRMFLGESSDKVTFPATFIWLDDDPENNISADGYCTWSDVRRGNPNRSAEYHLYYSAESESVVHQAKAGDQLIIAKKKDGALIIIICPSFSTVGTQLLWLFGLDLLQQATVSRSLEEQKNGLGLAAIKILEEIGLDIHTPEPDAFGLLLDTFGKTFPTTTLFSEFASNTLSASTEEPTPDSQLIRLMEHEEALFRHLEKVIVADRLQRGFMSDGIADVDGFVSFSLSVQNRRKSRAGFALANHVEAILKQQNIQYKREATTEKRNAADFLFPDEESYRNPDFSATALRMLAVKTSCKDRWRQVLAEADRISPKHLLTLEPSISSRQTDEMRSQNLKLVIPAALHDTYHPEQRNELLSFSDFLSLVR